MHDKDSEMCQFRMFLENQLVANASNYILTHIFKKSIFYLQGALLVLY